MKPRINWSGVWIQFCVLGERKISLTDEKLIQRFVSAELKRAKVKRKKPKSTVTTKRKGKK